MEIPEDVTERLRRLETFRGKAMRTARRCVSSYEDAQDAVQESLIKVALVPHLDWERVGGLVTTTTRNVCIDMIRSNARRARRDSLYFQQETPLPDLGDEVVEQLAARWLETNLHRLTPTERQILELHAAGKSVGDIATAVGLTYKGAHASLTRARRRMSAVWQAALAGFLGVVLPSRLRRSALAASAVGLGVAVTLTPHFLGAKAEPVVAVPDSTSVARVELPATSPAPTAQERSSVAPPAVRSSPTAPPGKPGRSYSVIPPSTGGVIGNDQGVQLDISDADQSLVASLMDCLGNGIHLDVHNIGCSWGERNTP